SGNGVETDCGNRTVRSRSAETVRDQRTEIFPAHGAGESSARARDGLRIFVRFNRSNYGLSFAQPHFSDPCSASMKRHSALRRRKPWKPVSIVAKRKGISTARASMIVEPRSNPASCVFARLGAF